jgi:tetratricopeptide (TPR) repeat protein
VGAPETRARSELIHPEKDYQPYLHIINYMENSAMAAQTIDLKCPSCGAPWGIGMTECSYCGTPVVISTFNSVYDMPLPMVNKIADFNRRLLTAEPENKELNNSAAMCYLKLKLYDKALTAFEKAMEDNFDNSETFFYAAICLLGGKKAFLAPRPIIDKIEEYINAAMMIEPKGVYYYFWAYVKWDYFSRKSYKTAPTYQEMLVLAKKSGVSQFDCQQLFGILRVDCPEQIKIY